MTKLNQLVFLTALPFSRSCALPSEDESVEAELDELDQTSQELVVDCGAGQVITGNYTINTPASLTSLSGVTQITGNLKVIAPGLQTLALPTLRCVGGKFEVTKQQDLKQLSLTNLHSAGWIHLELNGKLESLAIPELQKTSTLFFSGGKLSIFSAPKLEEAYVQVSWAGI